MYHSTYAPGINLFLCNITIDNTMDKLKIWLTTIGRTYENKKNKRVFRRKNKK